MSHATMIVVVRMFSTRERARGAARGMQLSPVSGGVVRLLRVPTVSYYYSLPACGSVGLLVSLVRPAPGGLCIVYRYSYIIHIRVYTMMYTSDVRIISGSMYACVYVACFSCFVKCISKFYFRTHQIYFGVFSQTKGSFVLFLSPFSLVFLECFCLSIGHFFLCAHLISVKILASWKRRISSIIVVP